MEYRLKDYINKLEESYKVNRTQYYAAAETIDKLKKEHDELVNSGRLSEQGLQEENASFNTKKAKALEEMRKARDGFLKLAEEVRKEVEVKFKYLYSVNPKDIDSGAAALLERGILNQSEIIDMAREYKANNNLTMYRFVASYIKDYEGIPQEVRYMVSDAKRKHEREDLKQIESFTNVCEMGLREGEEVFRARAIDNRHAEFLESALEAAQAISISVDSE